MGEQQTYHGDSPCQCALLQRLQQAKGQCAERCLQHVTQLNDQRYEQQVLTGMHQERRLPAVCGPVLLWLPRLCTG